MRQTVARLRLMGRWAVDVVLWWPWLSPAVAILLLAGAGHLGVGWLVWTAAGVGLVGAGTLLVLARMGAEASEVD